MPVSWTVIKKAREDRAALVAEGEKLLETATEDNNRDLTPEENTRFEEIHTDGDKLRDRIALMERQYYAAKETGDADKNNRDALNGSGSPDDEPEGRNRDGQDGLTADEKTEKIEQLREQAYEQWLRGGDEAVDPALADELRDLSVSVDNKGGYAAPSPVYDKIVVPMKEIDAVRRAGATAVTVSTSGAYDVPYIDDAANTGDMSAENAADSDADPAFGRADLTDYRFDSDGVPVSEQALMTRADLEPTVYRLLRQRIAQQTQSKFTVGTGSSQPQGVATGATSAFTAAAVAALTYDELITLFHSVGQMYRELPSFGWMMNDLTLAMVRKIKDSDGRPIFTVSEVLGTPDMINGRRVTVNAAMPNATAGLTPVVIGAFEHYMIKDVSTTRIKRDPYSRANKDQVVFHGFHNAGGDIADPSAFRKLTMAAS